MRIGIVGVDEAAKERTRKVITISVKSAIKVKIFQRKEW